MNIFIFETKSLLKSFAIWTLSILVTLVVFMQGVYPVFSGSIDSIKKILENFPKEFSAAFGLEIATMFSYEGFYGFISNYILLLGAIMAVSLSVSVFARERYSKCIDFILTKPVNRKKIFLQKLLAVILLLIVSNILYVAVSVIMYSRGSAGITGGYGSPGRFAIASSSLFFTQLIFMTFGIIISVFPGKVPSAAGAAASFGFGAFVISAFSGIINERVVSYFAVLKYFNPVDLFTKGSFDIGFVIFAAIIIVAGTGASFVKFIKSDMRAV